MDVNRDLSMLTFVNLKSDNAYKDKLEENEVMGDNMVGDKLEKNELVGDNM